VYGFRHCKYEWLKEKLEISNIFDNVYDYRDFGNEGVNAKNKKAIKLLEKIKVNDDIDLFKGILTTVVFENYKRKKMGEKLIPVIMCIDITNNPFPLTLENFILKGKFNALITHKELRRSGRFN